MALCVRSCDYLIAELNMAISDRVMRERSRFALVTFPRMEADWGRTSHGCRVVVFLFRVRQRWQKQGTFSYA